MFTNPLFLGWLLYLWGAEVDVMHINETEQEVFTALECLAEFLSQLSLYDRAKRIEELKEQLLQGKSRQIFQVLLGAEFWGGAGSYFDLFICRENFPFLPNDADLSALNNQYIQLLFRLAKALKRANVSSYWLDSAYEILRKWTSRP